jgi:hypothetical protein
MNTSTSAASADLTSTRAGNQPTFYQRQQLETGQLEPVQLTIIQK